jgi:hypothetical protein
MAGLKASRRNGAGAVRNGRVKMKGKRAGKVGVSLALRPLPTVAWHPHDRLAAGSGDAKFGRRTYRAKVEKRGEG